MRCGKSSGSNPGDVVVATARPEGFATSDLGGKPCPVDAVYPIGRIN